MLIAGALFDRIDESLDGVHIWNDSQQERMAYFFPQGNRRVHAYLAYEAQAGYRLSIESALPHCIEQGVGAKAIGPLATFAGADVRVEHSFRQGVALIGDAAASSDPIWG